MNINDRIAQAVGHVKHETPKPFKSSRPIKTFKTFHDDLDKTKQNILANHKMSWAIVRQEHLPLGKSTFHVEAIHKNIEDVPHETLTADHFAMPITDSLLDNSKVVGWEKFNV